MTWPLFIGLLTLCLLWLTAWTCEWVKADGKWVEGNLSPYVKHYPSAAALCLFMRSPNHFQLHGPQTRPLIPSHFPVKVHQFVPSSCTFRLGHLHQQLQRNELMHRCIPSPSSSLKKKTHTHTSAIDTYILTCLHNIWHVCWLSGKEDSVAFPKP